jgi:hypothetical protein
MIIGRFKKLFFVFIICVFCFYIYKYSPYKVEFLGYYDKIWAHRVNSNEKLNSALNYYEGVELDLVYKKGVLDVNHPPAESINLGFREYFNQIPTTKQPFLWLDIKNLTKENSTEILNLLQSIFKERNYPLNKVLIETRYPKALPIFTQIGFKTSFYLPYGLRNKKNLDFEINKITETLNDQPEIGISSDYRDHYLMKKYFPEKTKYLWMINSVTNRWFTETRSILKDSTVKVVLVRYNAVSGNR